MPKQDDSTLYDRETNRLKNMPWVVKIIAFTVFVAGLATLITNYTTIKEFFSPTESSAPKVRVQYYTIGGQAISLLLLGKLNPTLQKHLGGKPVVWQNQVYEEVRNLHNKFATGFSRGSLESEAVESEDLEAVPANTKMMQFAKHRSVEIDESNLLNDPKLGNPMTAPGWKIAWVKDNPRSELIEDLKDSAISIDRLTFSKRLSCQDALESFERIGVMDTAFFENFGSQGCEGLTFDVVAHYLEEGCGSEGWDAWVYVPGLSLEVAIIQNISDKAIRIEEVKLGVKKAIGIGPAKSSSPPVTSKGTFGDGTLLANDRLIVPLSLRFSSEFTDSDFLSPDHTYPEADLGSSKTRALFSGNAKTSFFVFRGVEAEQTEETGSVTSSATDPSSEEAGTTLPEPNRVEITIGSLLGQQLISKYGYTPNDPRQELPYVGTILSPISIVIDGLTEKVHSIQLGAMYISDTFSGGSCPYLYAEESEGKQLELGKILVRRDAATKRGTDSRYVPNWLTRVIVKEHDPETTYLHGVNLVCETPMGDIISKAPAFTTSPFKSGAVVMKRGQSQTIDFEPLDPGTLCESVFIKVDGYYVPDIGAKPARKLSLIHRESE